MRVADLHPQFSVSPPGDPSTGLVTFMMDCPFCGAPWRLSVSAYMGSSRDIFHGYSVQFRPMIDWDTLTITPSVDFKSGTAHGRKRPCSAHFTITNGNITPHGAKP